MVTGSTLPGRTVRIFGKDAGKSLFNAPVFSLFQREHRKECYKNAVDKHQCGDQADGEREFADRGDIGMVAIHGLIGDEKNRAAVQDDAADIHERRGEQPAGRAPDIGR